MAADCPVIIEDGVKIFVNLDPGDMTAYALLEHEDWFEEEIKFVRTLIVPGMHAYDIGANHGVYAFAMAARMPAGGHVWAFEPTHRPLAMLQASLAANDFADRVTIVPLALSDRAGTSRMGISSLSETSSLRSGDGDGQTEEVQLQTLDAVWSGQGEPAIDFVKLDAEGEEENILKGGRRFLSVLSPLIMFEAKCEKSHNLDLLTAFRDLGYDLFRLLPGLGVLVPHADGSPLDPFQLNLFACKPDRAAALAGRGLLITNDDAAEAQSAPPALRPADRAYAAPFAAGWRDDDPAVALALAGEAPGRPAADRRRWLERSLTMLENDPHPAAGLTRIRVLRALGRFADALLQFRALAPLSPEQLAVRLGERPFLPPLPAWDSRPALGGAPSWCAAMMTDAMRACSHFSSFFDQTMWGPLWEHRNNPNLSPIMRRTLLLPILRAGQGRHAPPGQDVLLQPGPEHRNAAIWRMLLKPDAAVS